MPKLKTHKATKKRIRYTGAKKILRRRAGQDHFNARETGTAKQRKRRDVAAHKAEHRAIKKLTPYH